MDGTDLNEIIRNYELCKPLLSLRLLGENGFYDSYILNNKAIKPVSDLYLCVCINGTNPKIGRYSTLVTDSLISLWNRGVEEVFSDAEKNFEEEECETMSLNSMISTLIGKNPVNTNDDALVIGNKNGYFGAGIIFSSRARAKIWEYFVGESQVLVIPSSVHELIVMKIWEDLDDLVPKIDEIVRDVNKFVVENREILSNHCYILDKNSGKLDFFRSKMYP